MNMKLLKSLKRLSNCRWALGFVRGGIPAIMDSKPLEIDWVKMPSDRWFADPFVLDVTEKEILLLVEDYAYATQKGIISLLYIDRKTMTIAQRKEILEIPTHLSFPAIWRHNEHIYVYPESANSKRLDMYEFHPDTESLTFVSTICNDVVWDSYISEDFGEPLLFTAAHDDYHLDIYKYDKSEQRYVPAISIPSVTKNSRMGGGVFEYNNSLFYPAQNCERVYGGAIDIKRIDYTDGDFAFTTVKQLTSPNRHYPLGLHTLNEYKGVAVIDVKGYRYGLIGAFLSKLVKLKKQIKHAK